jgi:hypothetical protein
MSTLSIHRWHNSYRAGHGLSPEVLQNWDEGLCSLDVSCEIYDLVSAEELVFIRQLHLKTRFQQDHDQTQAAESWRTALSRELSDALEERRSNTNIVRYRCRRDAVCDMLYRACGHDTSRNWVWIQMGLMDSGTGTHHPNSVMRLAVAELLAEPSAIWPTLTRLIEVEPLTGALTLLLQHLPPADLDGLLLTCPQTAPYQKLVDAEFAEIIQGTPAVTLPSGILVEILLTWSSVRLVMTDHYRLSRYRRPLIVLLAAAANAANGMLTSFGSMKSLLAASTALLDKSPPPPARPHDGERREKNREKNKLLAEGAEDLAAEPSAANDVYPSESEGRQLFLPSTENSGDRFEIQVQPKQKDFPPLPELPDAVEAEASAWVGLLFLLHLLPPAGLLKQLDQLEATLQLPPDIMPRVLSHLASAVIGIPARDPAVRAFCGGWQPDANVLGDDEAIPAFIALVSEQTAHSLNAILEQRVPDMGITEICQRPGMIHFERGWIEVHIPMQYAHLRLRRAALDLDPGWLPWLGCVVRFIYE